MEKGLYTATTGMLATMAQQDTIANNLANVNTTGYKRDITVFKSFPKMLIRRLRDNFMRMDNFVIDRRPPVGVMGTGVEVNENYTVFNTGGVIPTGNQLDFAIEGEGFFTLDTPYGERYTRNGINCRRVYR